jgi:hypothetical protein
MDLELGQNAGDLFHIFWGRLLDTPQDVPFFRKLLQREIVYRLLQEPHGEIVGVRCNDGGPKLSNG